jgi:hypothetical protein
MHMKTTGRCLCGAIQYEYEGEPLEVAHCHCESCRRQASSPIATFVTVTKATLRFTQGEPKEFASSPGVRRSFCGGCGAPIAYWSERRPDVVDLFAGTLADPTSISPSLHTHAAEQLPWFEVLDDLPRYAVSSRGTAPMRYGPRSAPPEWFATAQARRSSGT